MRMAASAVKDCTVVVGEEKEKTGTVIWLGLHAVPYTAYGRIGDNGFSEWEEELIDST